VPAAAFGTGMQRLTTHQDRRRRPVNPRYDTALVRELLREQHPDLAGLELREVDGGWDNQMWRLGEDLAVRMPRTERGPALLRTEQRWLPVLAASLPLPVPVPVRVGEPSGLFPRTWTITRWVHGEPADRAPVSSPGSAGRLAGFLRALHCPAPAGAPVSPDRGVGLERHDAGFSEGLKLIGSDSIASAARRTWELAVAAPAWTGPPVWLHGDLHPANVVVADGTLAGVLDFGELCAGDAATDLSAAWLLLPAGQATAFLRAYGRADDAAVLRARGWAVMRALNLIAIGQAGERGLPGGKPTWLPAGRATLQRVLADS
jgi:aminoglycoside phosphotransferase (APT) family kinase protein